MAKIYETAAELAEELKQMSETSVRLAIFGQPGAGKSSLINTLLHTEEAVVSQRTDTTQDAMTIEKDGFFVTDLPGYGTAMFPKEAYWERFNLESYDAFVCVFDGKMHADDVDLFQEVQGKQKPCLFVRNKVDSLFQKGQTKEQIKATIVSDVQKQLGFDAQVIFTSCATEEGMEQLEAAIRDSLTPAKKQRWIESAQAKTLKWLEEKKENAKKKVHLSAAGAALNGINPIPGVNVAVDITVMMTLFDQLRKTFGITEEFIVNHEKILLSKGLAQLANGILKTATTEGIKQLLLKAGSETVARTAVRYVPFIGPAIAATAGYAITLKAGMSYLEDCYEVAKAILEDELTHREIPV